MTAIPGVHQHAQPLPSLPRPNRVSHRAATVTGGHPLMSNPGAHVLARKSLWPYLAVVLLPLIGALLILFALGLFGHPSAPQVVPAPVQVSVSPSACTFPDGS